MLGFVFVGLIFMAILFEILSLRDPLKNITVSYDMDMLMSEPGEQITATATGRIYDAALEIAPFDRVRFDGAVWEVRSVEQWPSHRKATVERV